MTDFGGPQVAHDFRDRLAGATAIFVRSSGRLEVARMGEAVRSDRTEIRKTEQCAVVFADVATRVTIEKLDAKPHAAWNHNDLLWLGFNRTELGVEAKATVLQDDQHLAVCAVEVPVLHRPIGRIEMDAAAALRSGIAVPGHCHEALHKVLRLCRNRQRIPAQLIRRGFHIVETMGDPAVVAALERPMHGSGANTIKPRATIRAAWGSEGRAGKLLRIEAVRRFLRRILADRQRPSERFGRELVAEA